MCQGTSSETSLRTRRAESAGCMGSTRDNRLVWKVDDAPGNGNGRLIRVINVGQSYVRVDAD